MGKALKTVGAVIGAAALIATGAGAILMPGMAGTTTLFGVSVGTLNTVSAGLMAVGGMLDKPESIGSGTPDEWNSNPDQPTPFAFGRVGCSGKIIHRDEYGKDNKLQGIVSVYSGAGPIKSFVSYKVNDLPVSFVSNGGTATGKYNRQMWRSWRLGEQPDTALSLPTGLDEGAVMPAWGPAYKLSGKACELLTVQQDSKFSVYPMGLPTPQAVIEGVYGYDPRYDSTYPGGFGDCRLGVRSTYRWINNPIIAALNWALGMVENGHVVGGIGASPQGIDMPAFVEAANVSDANGWTVSAWPDTSEDVSQVLKQFLQAGGASYARHAGKISCVSRGAAKPSIVTVTGRDTCGPIELDTGASLYNRINTITPSFMSEVHGWKHVPADPVTFEALRIEDGGKRGDQITYRFADNPRQAGQLAAYDILDAREPFSGTVPFKPHLRRLKRGDCFVLDEPGFLLDGVKCIVLGRSYNAQIGEVRVSFRSETDSKHPLALGKTTTMPEYPVLTPVDPTFVSPPEAGDWTITPRPPVPGGGQVPGFDLSGEVSNDTATAIIVEYGPSATGPWKQAYQGPPTVTNIPIDGVQPGASYFIAIQYQRNQNYSAREVYGPYTAPLLDPSPTAPTIVNLDGRIDEWVGNLSAEASIREQADQTLASVSSARPNLVPNSTAAQGMQGLSNFGSRIVNAHSDSPSGPEWSASASEAISESFGAVWTASISATGNVPYSLQAEMAGWAQTGGEVRVVGLFKSETGATLDAIVVRHLGGAWEKHKAENIVAPAGTTRIDFQIDTFNVSFGLNGSAAWRRIKLEQGPICTNWTDDQTLKSVSASVAQQALAIIDLQTGQALAKFEVAAEATGSKPTRLRLISGSLGSAVALDFDQLYLGDNTVFDDGTDTEQTTIGSNVRVIAKGLPFGADGNLTEWWGPTGVALSAMTTANGHNGRMQTAPYVFDNVSPSQFRIISSSNAVAGSRSGAGTVTTSSITFTVIGATGPVQFNAYNSGGDTSIVATNPTAIDSAAPFEFVTAFRTTVGIAEHKLATFAISARDAAGNTTTAFVQASLAENT